jgi:hypothetical protein
MRPYSTHLQPSLGRSTAAASPDAQAFVAMRKVHEDARVSRRFALAFDAVLVKNGGELPPGFRSAVASLQLRGRTQ